MPNEKNENEVLLQEETAEQEETVTTDNTVAEKKDRKIGWLKGALFVMLIVSIVEAVPAIRYIRQQRRLLKEAKEEAASEDTDTGKKTTKKEG